MPVWSPERRYAVNRKIDKEADRAAARLGARCAILIAFFDEGEDVHMQEGGRSPIPLKQLYQSILTAIEMMEQSGGNGVFIQ